MLCGCILCDVPLPVGWSLGAGPAQTQTSPSQGVRNVASVCLQIGYPTIASVPHSIVNGYKRVLAVAVETDYTFPLAEKVTATPDRRLRGCRVLAASVASLVAKAPSRCTHGLPELCVSLCR